MNVQRLLVDFYTKYKDVKAVQWMRDVYSHESAFPYDRIAMHNLEKLRALRPDSCRKIRVCFIVNDPNVWNKQQRIYQTMLGHPDFEPMILCVPDLFIEADNAAWDFFHRQGTPAVNAKENAGWFNLKAWKPDYVFYAQPYNNYLPRCYRSFVISRYAKVCILIYGVPLTWNFLETSSRSFHRDVYLRYAAVPEEIDYYKNMFPDLSCKGLQETKHLGFPAFQALMEQEGISSPSFAFSHNAFRAIWTPRWNTDENLGGSNFFRYKDVLFTFAKYHPDMDFLFRPHPMALDHFLTTGEMTLEEVNVFRETCRQMPNVSLDTQKGYATSFWDSSVLISDLSSVIAEYFITGKPIIYCKTQNPKQRYLDYFNSILTCCYVVNSDAELLTTLDMLKNGQDPLRNQRQQMITKLFGDTLLSSSQRIVADIEKDYRKG